MSKTVPLRIDSELVHQARSAGALFDRPPTAQIEHWAKLGRVLDAVLSGKSVASVKECARVSSIEKIVAFSQTKAGQAKARAIISRHGGPVYESDSMAPGIIVERLPDGSNRRGRFVNRRFVPE
jgi:hypothetical protein